MSDDLMHQVVQILGRGGPRPGWSRHASCAGTSLIQDPTSDSDGEPFFPARGDDGKDARALCEACPVQAQCLTEAIINRERWGIWGGMSTSRRDALVRDLYEAAS